MSSVTDASTPLRAGRPKSREKAADIRRAASDLFLAHGLRGTSMDAVAQAAGVSKQTVYSHFGSKEDLFAAVIEGKVTAYRLSGEELSDPNGLRDELEIIGERFVELLFDDEVTAMFRVVIGESITHPQIARLFHAAGPERTIDALARRLSHYANAGELNVETERNAAVTFLNLLRGEFHMRRLMNLCPRVSARQRRDHVRSCVSQFLRLFGTGASRLSNPRN
jgi:TetR/AcrR family transcriptional repressor of mexJK operon